MNSSKDSSRINDAAFGGHAEDERTSPPLAMLFTLAFVRLVVVGGIQFYICAVFVLPYIFPAGNVYMKMALLIECASPSANMCIGAYAYPPAR